MLRGYARCSAKTSDARIAEESRGLGLCLLTSDPPRAREVLIDAYDRLKDGGEKAALVRTWGAAIDVLWFEWEDLTGLDRFIDDLPEIESIVARSNDQGLKQILVRGAFAALSMRRPEHREFQRWEQLNLALLQRRLPRSEIMRRCVQLMLHYVFGSGERAKSELVLQRLRQVCDLDSESIADICMYYVMRASCEFWFSSDASQAPSTVMTGLAFSKQAQMPFWDVTMINAALFRLAADGQVDGMRNMLSLLEERLTPESRENDIAIGHHFTAYLAWLEGDPDKALVAINAACRIAEDRGFSLSPLYYGIGAAAILADRGQRRIALLRLRATRRRASLQNCATMVFNASMVGAAIALGAGKQAATIAYLRKAFSIGASKELRTVLWVRTVARNALCDLAAQSGIAPDFASSLKAAPLGAENGESALTVRTLGRIDILRRNRSVLTSKKPQVTPLLLMLHLVAAGHQGRSSDRLIDALWPDVTTETGRKRLKTNVYRLRRLLDDPGAVLNANGTVRFAADRVSIDAWEVENPALQRGGVVETAEFMLNIYQGEFVDLYSGHSDLIIYREQLASTVEAAALKAGETLTLSKDWERATALFRAALDRFGAHDEFFERLKICLESSGRHEALNRFERHWLEALNEDDDSPLKQPVG